MPWAVRRVTAADTFPLRQSVLRPHESTDVLATHSDAGETVHLAVVEAGTVIGCAMVMPERPLWPGVDEASWRLRGMATAADRRGEGIGAAVLDAVLAHVEAEGGGLVWCSARTRAVSFYERAGFVRRGDEWEEPELGPHVLMQLHVSG